MTWFPSNSSKLFALTLDSLPKYQTWLSSGGSVFLTNKVNWGWILRIWAASKIWDAAQTLLVSLNLIGFIVRVLRFEPALNWNQPHGICFFIVYQIKMKSDHFYNSLIYRLKRHFYIIYFMNLTVNVNIMIIKYFFY